MKINFNRFIQIAGVIDKEEAEMLIECGVEYLGFPLRLPVNKEDHTEEEAAEIIATLPSGVTPIVITYLNDHQEIINFANQLSVRCMQLHGKISLAELKLLKEKAPEISIIKSLIVRENNIDDLLEEIKLTDIYVDAYITDTFDPATGATGATGKTHDWSISRKIVQSANKPVILAGGLNQYNVKESIAAVKPAGVDSHTGVEGASGRKDKTAVIDFITEALDGFDKINVVS